MEVGDDAQDPSGNDRAGIFSGAEQRAFQMNMPVNKSRYQVFPPEVYDLLALLVVPHSGDQVLTDCYMCFLDPSGEGIHNLGIYQQQIGGGISPSYR